MKVSMTENIATFAYTIQQIHNDDMDEKKRDEKHFLYIGYYYYIKIRFVMVYRD